MSISQKEKQLIEILQDPVKWAEYELGFKARWYQAEILRCKSKKVVLRCARRLGKTTTMAVHMLWHAFTTKNATCLYIAPSDWQVRTMFEDINRLIAGSKGLKASIVRQTSNPYFIELGNGSVIKGITAGTKVGGKGFSLRGQKATWLYVDEMDYLSEDDWNAIIPIHLEAPKRIGIMVASTPTGKRGMFYKLCFTPDTPIVMADGTFRPISDVYPGDSVLTHLGEIKKVTQRFVHRYNGEIIKISFSRLGAPSIKCTPEHPFYVKRDGRYQWVEAKDLKPTDKLLIPVPKQRVQSGLSEEEAELLGYIFSKSSVMIMKEDKYNLDFRYRLYGIKIYLRYPELVDRVKYLVDKVWKIKSVDVDLTNNTVAIYSFEAANKYYPYTQDKVPHFLLYSEPNIVKAFLTGFLSNRSVIGKKCMTNIKREHLPFLFLLLTRLGVWPRLKYVGDDHVEIMISKTFLKEQLKGVIRYDWPEFRMLRMNLDEFVVKNGYCEVGIKRLERHKYSGFVYNIEVEDHHSYLASLIAVHNCTDKSLGFTEFHYPIMAHPEWSPEMERELRQIFTTEVAWEHEELAEFGTEVTGVFNKKFIDRARKDYHYIERPTYHAPRTMGVDWDKYGAETQIIVVEYDEAADKFVVINRVSIPKSQFTLDNAVQKIKELNAIYDPFAIYVDRGYGEYQVETLHKYGLEHPETGLAKKVRGVAFNESIEVIDPFTKQKVKKPVKPFMVDQFNIQLERDRIVLNDNDIDVWRDLENFNIVRYSASGQPIFTNENEHTVDALLLAITAFILEAPQIGGVIEPPRANRNFTITKVIMKDHIEGLRKVEPAIKEPDKDEPTLVKVPLGSKPRRGSMQITPRGSGSKGFPIRRTF